MTYEKLRLHFSRIAWVSVILLLLSCGHEKTGQQTASAQEIYYTCSMHPQVMEDHPGNCPICGMKLIAVPKSSTVAGNAVHLTAAQIRLGNIITDTIKDGSIAGTTVLPGTLNFDQSRLSTVSARIDGRVEKLYFKNTGDYVRKGEKLYELYSEQLNNAKQEFLAATRQEKSFGNTVFNYHALVESARNKLLLWGMSPASIEDLAATKKVSTLTTFYSTEEGYISDEPVKEGDYVTEGSTIVSLAGLSSLWAEAQVYTSQLANLDQNAEVTVQVPGSANVELHGRSAFVNPEMDPASRITLLRVTIPNKDNSLHPGMPVYVVVHERPHGSIVLPSQAVLTDSHGSTVWVETNPGTFSPRMVQTGTSDDRFIEVLKGLNRGDIVVTGGAYLVNSEYVFEHGVSPMQGMDMGR